LDLNNMTKLLEAEPILHLVKPTSGRVGWAGCSMLVYGSVRLESTYPPALDGSPMNINEM